MKEARSKAKLDLKNPDENPTTADILASPKPSPFVRSATKKKTEKKKSPHKKAGTIFDGLQTA